MNKSKVNIPNSLIPAKDKTVYLAISGGVDSMVLLYLLSKGSNPIHLLHVNYHLRNEDSIADESLVRQQAKFYKTEFSVLDFDMQKHLDENGGNLQNEARKIRYSFFEEHLGSEGILMTAHHFDDQMETFFMHLSRKSGIAGMSCMAAKNGNHIRPLLNFRKSELYDFAKENKVLFREDRSNLENKYLRNQWRNVWIPEMEKQTPGLNESIQVLIEAFQTERGNIESKYEKELTQIKKSKSLTFESYDSMSDEGKHFIAREIGIRPTELLELNQLRRAGKSKRLEIHRLNLIIWNTGDQFYIEYKNAFQVPKIVVQKVNSLPQNYTKKEVFLDPSKIVGKLNIRKWKSGDRISPIGMKGSKLVSDIIKDSKVSSQEKSNIYILEDEEKVLWIVGLKISKLGIADNNSKEISKISII